MDPLRSALQVSVVSNRSTTPSPPAPRPQGGEGQGVRGSRNSLETRHLTTARRGRCGTNDNVALRTLTVTSGDHLRPAVQGKMNDAALS